MWGSRHIVFDLTFFRELLRRRHVGDDAVEARAEGGQGEAGEDGGDETEGQFDLLAHLSNTPCSGAFVSQTAESESLCSYLGPFLSGDDSQGSHTYYAGHKKHFSLVLTQTRRRPRKQSLRFLLLRFMKRTFEGTTTSQKHQIKKKYF